AALAVDVQVDLLIGAFRLEVQQLGDQRVGHAGIDRGAEVDDALGEQVRVDVHDPLAPRVLSDDVRDRIRAHAASPFSPMRCLLAGMTWLNESTIPSMKPKSRASAAVYQW